MVSKKKSHEEFEKLKKIIEITLKKYGIRRAGIFGSYVRGEQNENSDIDILVEINDKNISLLDFAGIKLELQKELKKKVDLVEYKMLRPEIKDDVLNEEIRIL